MGLIIGLLQRLIKLLLYFSIFVAIVLLIPNLPPYTKFTEIKIEPTQTRSGVLSPNGALNDAQNLFTNKIKGPEAFHIFNGELYTGLATGEVVKISPGGHITFVTKIGQPCTGLTQEHICGRPLGLDIDEKNKILYVADAYHGIWKVDLKNDKKRLLVSPNVEIDGKKPKIFNSVLLDRDGNLYWTHSSSDFDLRDGALTCLSDPSGRLLHYNSAKNRSVVLLDNIWFANGLTISPDNQFVLVTESNKYGILKYHINGPKKGQSEVFIAGLPGIPDNIRALPDGSGVLAALYVAFDDENPLISQTLARAPTARKFLARLSRLIEMPFEFLNDVYPHVIFEEIIYKIGHFTSLSSIMPPMSGLVHLDWNGNIVASYFNTDKSIGTTSDAVVYNDKLYIGSPHSSFIASVTAPPQIKKAFTKNAAPSASKEEIKKKTNVDSPPTNKVVKEEVKVNKINIPKENKPPATSTLSPTATPKIVKRDEKKDTEKTKPGKTEEAKPKPVDTKPIKKETVPEPKPVEPKAVKQGAKVKTETVKTEQPDVKTEEKPKPVVAQPVKKQPVPDTKPSKPSEVKEKAPVKSDTVNAANDKLKTKPVEEKPIKQESKTKPVEVKVDTKPTSENVKVDEKKSSDTKTRVNEKSNIKETKENKVGSTQKMDKETNKVEEKSNIKTETVKAPHLKASEPKVETVKTDKPKVQKAEKKKDSSKSKPSGEKKKSIPDEIPVKEYIPSDSVQPPKEKLKVITRSGPGEIPNPN